MDLAQVELVSNVTNNAELRSEKNEFLATLKVPNICFRSSVWQDWAKNFAVWAHFSSFGHIFSKKYRPNDMGAIVFLKNRPKII
jgi:hypothetical protein